MQRGLSEILDRQAGLLVHLDTILHKHLYTTLVIAVLAVAAFCTRLQRRQVHSLSDAEAWTEDDKTLFESTPEAETETWLEESKTPLEPIPTLSSLISDYSHPLADALYEAAGIPTSGDLARRQLINPRGPVVLNSGDLAAMAPPLRDEERRHPWRRHSHPQPPSAGGMLSPSVTEAVVREDAVRFFRDDQVGKVWRRRTLEFGSMRQP